MKIIETWMSLIGISMACSTIPQIVKLIKRKSSDDVSLLFWFLILHGQIWWGWYGIITKSICLTITNFVCAIFSTCIIILVAKYKIKK